MNGFGNGRQFGAAAYTALKAATRRVLASCGPLKVAVSYSRIGSDSALQRFGSGGEDNADRFIPVDVALDLMAASGDVTLLHVLAGELGYDVVPSAAAGPNALAGAAEAMSGAAHLIADLSDVIKDGKITAAEIKNKDLIADIRQVIKMAASLMATLKAELDADSDTASGGDGA